MNNTLRDFAKNAIERLAGLSGKEFAIIFVDLKMECFRLFHSHLICSTVHGIDYFQNVLEYIDKPKSWMKQFDDTTSIYEKNFVSILEKNR